jgi:hypothetical protein
MHRFKALALPKATEFALELERNIDDTYPNFYYRPQNYGRRRISLGIIRRIQLSAVFLTTSYIQYRLDLFHEP